MTTQQRIQLRKLTLIVLAWTFIGVFVTIYDYMLLESHLSEGASGDFSFGGSLIFNLASGFFGGMIGGAYLIYIVNQKFRPEPYLKGIIAVFLGYLAIVTLIMLFSAVIQAVVKSSYHPAHPETIAHFKGFLFTTQHIKNLIFWAFIVALTQMTLQINDKFGQGLLWSMIIGRYHFPRKENRIFMFLDLKSSTSIAERLGNEQYHNLLHDLFADITDPILNAKGEIYQYVGDEVVISWNIPNGKEDCNCIDCFFQIRSTLQSKAETYQHKFGVLPEFKAGIHFGTVIAGEIGIIKRDITYSGDVLNTTARIQGRCNEYQETLLGSKELIELLGPGQPFRLNKLGVIPLRGKEAEVELIAVGK